MFCKMSEMAHRITIQRPQISIDTEGNNVETDRPDVQTVWAKVLPTASKISDGYVEKVQEIIYRVVVRYGVDIQVTDKIFWNDKILEIIAPPYLMDGKRKYIVIETRELIEDG